MNEESFQLLGKRVWVAGHRGMVGSAVVRRLSSEGCEVLTVSHAEMDLRRQTEVEAWLSSKRPDAVVVAAARVGGILANDTMPAEFLYDNLMIEANVIHGAWRAGVSKLLFLGSSCIYPRMAPQPMAEDSLLTGPLEPTNQWYAVAKIAGIKLCQAYRRQYGCNFISAMPTNLYGIGDNFDLRDSHVLPALLRKIHEAKRSGRDTIEVWGTGRAVREFLYVDDLADGLVFLLKHYAGEDYVNVGSGTEVSIAELTELIAETVGWEGQPVFDKSKPDGTPRKLMDGSRMNAMGWHAKTDLREGLRLTYQWFLAHSRGTVRGMG